MKVVFLTNYFNHHQRPFCEALYARLKDGFRFVSTREMGEERKKLGYQSGADAEYVACAYAGESHRNSCLALVDNADVVIAGSAPDSYLDNRRRKGKLIFRYSERLYKQGFTWYKWPVRAFRFWQKYSMKPGQYLLCASAYTAADFAITGTFKNRAYKWGYYPETVRYDLDVLMRNKNRKKILWCGRFLDWKHPDDVIWVAKQLQNENYDFQIDYIGTGDMEKELTDLICQSGLEDTVHLLGPMKPEMVRKHMEEAGIYLFTSDFREGWGAVLNESMNSGCAVVASHAIGSVPYLMDHEKNGLIYQSGNVQDLYNKIKYLLDKPGEQIRLGTAAYHSITALWNAEVAAERFVKLVDEIQDHGYCDLFEDGPCSRANVLKNDWFKG